MSLLSDLLTFIKDKNSPVVIFDSSSEEGFVLLRLQDYEDLTDEKEPLSTTGEKDISQLSKKDILNRINRDISIWQRKQQESHKKKRISKLQQELNHQSKNESDIELEYEKSDSFDYDSTSDERETKSDLDAFQPQDIPERGLEKDTRGNLDQEVEIEETTTTKEVEDPSSVSYEQLNIEEE